MVFSPNSTFISQEYPHLPGYIILMSKPNPLVATLLSSADFGGVAKWTTALFESYSYTYFLIFFTSLVIQMGTFRWLSGELELRKTLNPAFKATRQTVPGTDAACRSSVLLTSPTCAYPSFLRLPPASLQSSKWRSLKDWSFSSPYLEA